MRSGTIAPVEGPTLGKSIRIAAGIISTFDAIAWLALVAMFLGSESDLPTKGLDKVTTLVTTILFALTGAPALVLAVRGRAPLTAVTLALAFPIVFLAMLLAVAYTLP